MVNFVDRMIVKDPSHVWPYYHNLLDRFNAQNWYCIVICSDVFFGNQQKSWGTIFSISSTCVSLFRHSQVYFLGVANKLCFTVSKYSICFWWRDPVLSLHGHDSHLFFKCLGRGPNVFPSVISVELRNSNGFWRPSDFFRKSELKTSLLRFSGWKSMAIGGKTWKQRRVLPGFLSCCRLFCFVPNGVNRDCDEYN